MRKLSMDELGRKTTEQARRAEKFPLILILENIRSAYNVGSAFRTADAFQVESVYLTGYTAFPPHKEIRKTALGAEDSVAWRHFPDAGTAIERARSAGYRILAVEQTTESLPLQALNPAAADKIAFVFGNEVSGVDSSTLQLVDACVEIPQGGMKHSLNVATALGVVVWECIRTYAVHKSLMK